MSLTTADLPALKAFYGEVLGWKYRPGFGHEEYAVALSDGVPIAGLGERGHVLGVPACWSVHFAEDSADLAAERIRERGGTVAVGPLAFGPGRVAWAIDPAGAPFALWEGPLDMQWAVGGARPSVRLDLHTRDVFAAAIFYSGALGWDTEPPERCTVRYEDDQVFLDINGRTVAALHGGALEQAPDPKIRPRWQVAFRTPDPAAAAERAVAAGGMVVTPPENEPPGSGSTGPGIRLRDPWDTLFCVTA
ncbi:VOC family protein [Streptomyces sp. H10-C2]|uniref:VOC family protein n=1 Tax=unclassified Streptomyces TaxID=2593676 RepID=UPI0024BA4AC9|nr:MULTISPECIES: VOC family protein [unclassified Streptomyces]MDJ0343362.1 VOC family protein [Streptomyces sp. PH10-H1]MDJ0371827.1 VOC family protein [Streptomyces sp. H10-C2]